MARRDIVVIGASAGGIQALGRLVEQLPGDLPAALCVVQHMSPESPGVLPSMLDRRSELQVVAAEEGRPIETGVIYVAAPDRHLLIKSGKLALTRGPRENRARPAIDPLFRSAADNYGPRAIGIVLSGMLNDGTAGLRAIKKRCGKALVQDPGDALYPEMPQSALDYVAVDDCRPVDDMGDLIGRLVAEPLEDEMIGRSAQTAREVEMEDSINGQTAADEDWGTPAPFTCPDCGGPLRERSEEGLRQYRCKIGHRYTAETLLAGQGEAVEQALEVALRTLEERGSMLQRMADEMRERNRRLAESFEQRAEESRKQADLLREVLGGR